MKELVDLARAKPGELSYGTSGIAGSSHLAGAMLENMTGTKMINVPFKGNGPALAEVMAGRVTFMFYPIIGIAARLREASSRRSRSEQPRRIRISRTFPPWRRPLSRAGGDAPWVGMLVPAGTPAPVVNRLADEIRKSLAKPDIRAKMKEQGAGHRRRPRRPSSPRS